jgi:hypothetical protein
MLPLFTIENRTNKIGTGHLVRIRKDPGLNGVGLAKLHCTYIQRMELSDLVYTDKPLDSLRWRKCALVNSVWPTVVIRSENFQYYYHHTDTFKKGIAINILYQIPIFVKSACGELDLFVTFGELLSVCASFRESRFVQSISCSFS